MEKQFKLELDANGMVSSKEIHGALGISKAYTTWMKTWIKNLDVKQGEDFIPYREESSGGRPSHDYLVNKDMAMSLVMVSKAPLSNQLRKYLISLFEKRQNLELITPEEAVFANSILDCLQFLNNQKLAEDMHREAYIRNTLPYGKVHAQFNSYRNNLNGWSKEKIEKALIEYEKREQHNVKATTMRERLNIINTPEAIRVATMDLLLSNDTALESVNKFANLVKKMAQLKKVEPKRENETNLFEEKKSIMSLTEISNSQKSLN
jgi:phage anti-repressor protein